MSELIDYLSQRKADESFVSRVLELDEAVQFVLYDFSNKLSPSASTLREYLELAEEISKRESVGLKEVLAGEEILPILEGAGSKKEKQKLIRKSLEKRRFPEYHQLLDSLNQEVEKIRKDTGVSLDLPADLEGDRLSSLVSVRSSEDCVAIAENIPAPLLIGN